MKRVCLVVLFFCFLIGCSSLSSPASSKELTTQIEEPLTLLSFPDQPKKYFEQALNAANLDFEVRIIEVPQNQYEDKVRMLLSVNEAPDLILIDTPNIAHYAISGQLEPLDNYWPEEDFSDLVDSAKESVIWNDHRWACPLNEASCLLFYNRRLLQEAGIQPPDSVDDAWTMEELLEAAIALTKKDSSGKIVQYGLQPTMFSPNNKVEGMGYTQMLYTWWFGADILSPDGTTATGYFDSQENIAALQFFSDLYQKYQVSPLYEIPNGFENGKIAMIISGPWLIGNWRDSFPDFYQGQWGAMPLPHGVSPACPTGSWNVAMTAQCKNKENAWQVINALTGQQGMTIWCNGTGNIAARQSVIDQVVEQNQELPYNIIYEQLENFSCMRPVTPMYPNISEAVIDCYNSVAFGADPISAAQKATKKINQFLKEQQVLYRQ